MEELPEESRVKLEVIIEELIDKIDDEVSFYREEKKKVES